MSEEKKKINTNTTITPKDKKNALDPFATYKKHQKKNTFMRVFATVALVIVAMILLLATLQKVSGLNIGGNIATFFTNQITKKIIPEKQINFLIAGIGGVQNDAPNLTDSILVASFNIDEGFASIVSIPRDLYIETNEFGATRINEIYARSIRRYGEDKAADKLKKKVEEIINEPIDYHAIIDFKGFEKFIDILGGIEVYVPEKIVDDKYPDNNWGYTTFRLNKGRQILDGETALKFVRSRKSTSDFDRSNRQQLIIKGIKERLINDGIVLKPKKIKSLYNALQEHIVTNLEISEMITLGANAMQVPNESIMSFTINDSCYIDEDLCATGGFLYVPMRDLTDGKAVLLPETATVKDISNYDTIHKFINSIFHNPEMFLQQKTIHIFNGTKTRGLAGEYKNMLRKYGFSVADNALSNLPDSPYEKTQILYHHDETNPDESIQATLDGLELLIFTTPQPDILPKHNLEDLPTDIEIILMDDATLFLDN